MSQRFAEGHVTPCAAGDKFTGMIADKILACTSEAQLESLKPLALAGKGSANLAVASTSEAVASSARGAKANSAGIGHA